MTTDCLQCAIKQRGGYFLHCVTCCARLIIDSRPPVDSKDCNAIAKNRQEAHLETIRRLRGAPSRGEILEEMKRLDAIPEMKIDKKT